MNDHCPLNVLFILVDDLRPELGCYGRADMVTPHIDALAASGMRFDRHYCQQAICGPSRCNIMTGCRPDTTGVYNLQTRLREAMPGALTLPEHFKRHGYHTASIGKVYHHGDDDLQAWSVPPRQPRGAERGRGYLGADAVAEMEHAQTNATTELQKGKGPICEAVDVPDNAYSDGLTTDEAIADLARLGDQPFFLAVGYNRPHLPCCAPKRYWDLYDPDAITLPENAFEPAGRTPYTLTNFGELRSYSNVPAEGPVPDELAREYIHGYRACVSYLDAQVGRLLAALEQKGLRENTVVVLCVDHGTKLGEHASWSKHTVTEVDTHIPLIISPPARLDVNTGSHTTALTENVDIYPTLCALCDLPTPAEVEGMSLVPLLNEPSRPWKQAAFMQYPRGAAVMGYAIRTDRFRYVEWRRRSHDEVLARELYDHEQDPHESVNAIDQPGYADAVDQLAAMLRDGWGAGMPS